MQTQSAKPVASNDQSRWDALEALQAAMLDIRYQRDVGLPFSADEIGRLGGEIEGLALEMVGDYPDDLEARGLLSRLVQASKALSLGVALQSARDSALTTAQFTDESQPITPYNVHQVLRREDDASRRKAIIAHLCQPDSTIDDADEARRTAQWQVSSLVGMTPLDEFLASEAMTADSLKNLLLSLGDGLGAAARTIQLGRRADHFPTLTDPMTWEDAVGVGVRGDARKLKQQGVALEVFDGLAKVVETAHKMGFPAERVYADLADRPKKYPGATAYRVRIPTDVRIRVKPLGDPVSDTVVLFHEMGHALHFITVDPELPLAARIGFNFATSETFSYWLQSLWMSPQYLTDEIGLPPAAASAMIRSANEGFLLNAVAISATALAIVDYWLADAPSTLDQIEQSLSGYMDRFLGYTLPPGAIRWYTSSVLALEINMLGYPVALARLAHLLSTLEARRTDWWNSSDAVDPVRRFMSGGRRAGFPAEMFDTAPFIDRVLNGIAV